MVKSPGREIAKRNISTLDRSAKKLYQEFHKIPQLTIDTPYYIIDKSQLYENFISTSESFNNHLQNIYKPYFPIKINNHPFFSKTAVECGYGLECASISEINQAISSGAKDIIYYSPGKKLSDLNYALTSHKNIQIHIDNFTDLNMLGYISNTKNEIIKFGVRLSFDFYEDRCKYGVHLDSFKEFFKCSKKYKNLKLTGIHFHTSRNRTPKIYEKSIETIGDYLKTNFKENDLKDIEYIDIGGGFEKSSIEGYYIKNDLKKNTINPFTTHLLRASSLENYTKRISKAINKNINNLLGKKIKVYTEIGRYIVSDSMHIISKVMDVKRYNNTPIIILDAGVNLIGWQRGMFEYFPIINISNYGGKKQLRTNIVGNLCTTRDVRGYRCYSKEIPNIGDTILLGNQGALTYSLAQSFINPIAKVYTRDKNTISTI